LSAVPVAVATTPGPQVILWLIGATTDKGALLFNTTLNVFLDVQPVVGLVAVIVQLPKFVAVKLAFKPFNGTELMLVHV
jgi:hypothetical protein